ncbi:hypothetical protein [Vibrio gallaecicus]|nr:hypothetical protein [Vibrio gallaecicus]MDN3616105.1 hypothetical protein [Vibrio gallaecicus]
MQLSYAQASAGITIYKVGVSIQKWISPFKARWLSEQYCVLGLDSW